MSQGFSKSTRRSKGQPESSGSKSASTATSSGDSADFLELQGTMGNAALASLVSADTTTSTVDHPRFSPLQRATLLSSNERLMLAALVYSESTAATEVTEEMLALASVGHNRVLHGREHPEDVELFGSTAMQDIVQDPIQFEAYGQSNYKVFNDAARFNSEFASQADLDHAMAAIYAATQIENSGNPFADDYLVFSADEDVPHADRIDESTKVTYGALTFWAFTPPTIKKLEEEEVDVAVDAGGAAESA